MRVKRVLKASRIAPARHRFKVPVGELRLVLRWQILFLWMFTLFRFVLHRRLLFLWHPHHPFAGFLLPARLKNYSSITGKEWRRRWDSNPRALVFAKASRFRVDPVTTTSVLLRGVKALYQKASTVQHSFQRILAKIRSIARVNSVGR